MPEIKFVQVTPDSPAHYQAEFIQVYKEVFAGPPYFETYQGDEVRNWVWKPHLSKGCIFLALDDEQVVGLSCSIPLKQIQAGEPNSDVRDFLSRYQQLPFSLIDACYMSEVAVLSNYRQRGIGTELIKQRWAWAKGQGIKTYVMRTASEGSNSLGIYLKLGARKINGSCQDVSAIGVVSASKCRIYLYGEII